MLSPFLPSSAVLQLMLGSLYIQELTGCLLLWRGKKTAQNIIALVKLYLKSQKYFMHARQPWWVHNGCYITFQCIIELEAKKWLFTHKSKWRNLERILPSYTGGQTAGTKLLFIYTQSRIPWPLKLWLVNVNGHRMMTTIVNITARGFSQCGCKKGCNT